MYETKHTVLVKLTCGHEARVHELSSVFDFPYEGTYCTTCEDVHNCVVPFVVRRARTGERLTVVR